MLIGPYEKNAAVKTIVHQETHQESIHHETEVYLERGSAPSLTCLLRDAECGIEGSEVVAGTTEAAADDVSGEHRGKEGDAEEEGRKKADISVCEGNTAREEEEEEASEEARMAARAGDM